MRSWDISSRFSIKLLSSFALKKDFLLDDQTFRLKTGIFPKVIGRISALRTAHGWKIFLILFVLKRLINPKLSQIWLQMSIRSAMMKIYIQVKGLGRGFYSTVKIEREVRGLYIWIKTDPAAFNLFICSPDHILLFSGGSKNTFEI